MTPTEVLPNPNSPMEVVKLAISEGSKVSGVKKASAFVEDNIIYIGLELYANVGKQESLAIERNVSDLVMAMESGYTVRITSDMDTVSLIATVALGISHGQAISDFNTQVHEVILRLTPKGA
jgi:hypothetical protein